MHRSSSSEDGRVTQNRMPTKTAIAIMLSFAVMATFVGVDFASAQVVHTPLVQIPGLTPTGAVNLSMYLVGLYDFLLSIVEISAIIGGTDCVETEKFFQIAVVP